MNTTATVIPLHRPKDKLWEGGYTRHCRRTWHEDSVLKGGIEVSLWHYLIDMAVYDERGMCVRSHGRTPAEVFLHQGEVMVTISGLAAFFSIKRDKVRGILQRLAGAKRIEISPLTSHSERARAATVNRQQGYLIKILNYKLYQGRPDESATAEPQRSHSERATNTRRKKEEGRKIESESLTNVRDYPPPQEHGSNYPSDRSANGLADRQFEDWWGRWLPGTKHEKRKAAKIYKSVVASGEVTHAKLCDGLDRYMTCCQRERRELRYIKHPTTWLNQGCWDDDDQPGGTPLRPNGKALPFACGL